MRLSPRDVASDLFSFLLFLRLALVSFLCFGGTLMVAKQYGPVLGITACLVALPLWWYHFGLPRFKERQSSLFSAEFCLIGYLAVAATLVVCVLEYFGIIQEGRPIHIFPKSHLVRYVIIFTVFCLYAFIRRKYSKEVP